MVLGTPGSAMHDALLALIGFGASRTIHNMKGATVGYGPCCRQGAEQSARHAPSYAVDHSKLSIKELDEMRGTE